MTFGSAKRLSDVNILFDGTAITRVRQYKCLGFVLDEDLSFKKHVDHVKKQVRPFIFLMWRNGKFIPMEKRKQTYFAYVHSHSLYMLAIYGECGSCKLKQLQTIQNRCIKALLKTASFHTINLSLQHRIIALG